jgi:hypothetical protein
VQDDLRAFVISGEASAESITALERITRDAAGLEHFEYASRIDPALVAAYGAAEWARITQREPEKFKLNAPGNVGLGIDDPERDKLEHLELERDELEHLEL